MTLLFGCRAPLNAVLQSAVLHIGVLQSAVWRVVLQSAALHAVLNCMLYSITVLCLCCNPECCAALYAVEHSIELHIAPHGSVAVLLYCCVALHAVLHCILCCTAYCVALHVVSYGCVMLWL